MATSYELFGVVANYTQTINTQGRKGYIFYELHCEAETDLDNNTSKVTTKLYAQFFKAADSLELAGFNISGTMAIGSQTASISGKPSFAGYVKLAEHTATVKHNTDGTKTISISAKNTAGSNPYIFALSAAVKLPDVPVGATVSCPDSYIGSTAKISIYKSNPNYLVTLKYKFKELEGTIVEGTSLSSYTWVIPSTFYEQIPNSKEDIVTLTALTYDGKGNLLDTETATFKAKANPANCAPVFVSPRIFDANTAQTVWLTKDTEKFVRYYSDAYIEPNAQARFGATLESIKMECGGQGAFLPYNSSFVTLYSVESATFKLIATDSRGFTTTWTIEKTLIPYVKLTCNLEAAEVSAMGAATLTVSGSYFNGSFGGTDNNLYFQYRYKLTGGSFTEWATGESTISYDKDKYTAEITLAGLDYQKDYIFEVRAVDMLETVDAANYIAKTTPVFDWGEHDFRFNVPVYAPAFINENKVLWSGGFYMQESHTIALAEPISEQANGIVLIFSHYDTETNKASNHSFNMFFVPKYQVEAFDGAGCAFQMSGTSFSNMATKYLYIYDSSISGHSSNVATGTANGITFANNKYVLRAVIGV